MGKLLRQKLQKQQITLRTAVSDGRDTDAPGAALIRWVLSEAPDGEERLNSSRPLQPSSRLRRSWCFDHRLNVALRTALAASAPGLVERCHDFALWWRGTQERSRCLAEALKAKGITWTVLPLGTENRWGATAENMQKTAEAFDSGAVEEAEKQLGDKPPSSSQLTAVQVQGLCMMLSGLRPFTDLSAFVEAPRPYGGLPYFYLRRCLKNLDSTYNDQNPQGKKMFDALQQEMKRLFWPLSPLDMIRIFSFPNII